METPQQHTLTCPRHLDHFSQPWDHNPTKSAHSSALSGQENPEHQQLPIKATGALALRSTAAHSPAGKGFKGHQAQPLHFPREKTGPEMGPEVSEPWDKSLAKPGAPRTAQASVSVQRQFRCLERPQPLHPKLLSFAGPYFCQLSAVAAATNLVEGKDGQCRVTASPLHSFDLIPTPPSLPLPCYSK